MNIKGMARHGSRIALLGALLVLSVCASGPTQLQQPAEARESAVKMFSRAEGVLGLYSLEGAPKTAEEVWKRLRPLGFKTTEVGWEYPAADGVVHVNDTVEMQFLGVGYTPTRRGAPTPALLDVLARNATSVQLSGPESIVFNLRDVKGGSFVEISLRDGAWIRSGASVSWGPK